MKSGIIKFYKEEKGYGFIKVDGSPEDAFFHHSDILGGANLTSGDSVSFEMGANKDGRDKAVNVRLVERSPTGSRSGHADAGPVGYGVWSGRKSAP